MESDESGSVDWQDAAEATTEQYNCVTSLAANLLDPASPSSQDEADVIQKWLNLNKPLHEKYDEIDLGTILQENCENSGWLSLVSDAFSELECYGKRLLKTNTGTSVQWGRIQFQSRPYKVVDKIKGGKDILKQMGFTVEEDNSLAYPTFPNGVINHKNAIARITASLALARSELSAFEEGRHPNEERIKEYASIDERGGMTEGTTHQAVADHGLSPSSVEITIEGLKKTERNAKTKLKNVAVTKLEEEIKFMEDLQKKFKKQNETERNIIYDALHAEINQSYSTLWKYESLVGTQAQSTDSNRQMHDLVAEKNLEDTSLPAGLAEGLWQCTSCNTTNSAVCDACEICLTPRGNLNTKKNKMPGQIVPDDLWSCEFCTFTNTYDVHICGICGKTNDVVRETRRRAGNARDMPAAQPYWSCEYCTTENTFDAKQCYICGEAPTRRVNYEDCLQKEAEEVKRHLLQAMEAANDVENEIQQAQKKQNKETREKKRNDEIEARRIAAAQEKQRAELEAKQLAAEKLAPILALTAVEDDHLEPRKESEQYDNMKDEKIVQLLLNKDLPLERRVRMALVEGNIQDWSRAENAITIIDDDCTYGTGVTVRHVVDAVNIGEGDVASAKKILRKECQGCYDNCAADQIHILTFCDCRMCTECFQESFEVLIRDKQVTDWNCQFCNLPKMHGEDMDVALIENHFQFLGIKVQQFLTKETYSIFTEKLSEWNLRRDPNFVYCPYPDCVSGFIHHGRLKVQCPQCNRFFCWKCKEAWTGDHDNKDCEEFKKIQIEKGETSIREEMKGSCITCPNCKCQFDLARGGCMHFSCSQCRYEFCGGCYQRFYNDERLGLNCKHLRNCYSNLRDMDVTQLHNLLKTSGIQFDSGDDNNDTKVCQVQETAEEDGHVTETACSKQIEPNHNGMCLKHYKEYLAKVINENKIDPLPEMDVNDLCQELRRRDCDVPEKSPDEGDGEYSQTLRDLIKETIPLQDL